MVAIRLAKSLAAGWMTVATLLAAGTAVAQEGESQVICREDGGKRSYRLQFNWTNDTVTIASRFGNGQWKTAYKNGTAVRNGANDASFLAEGVPAQFVGEAASGCGRFVETWYFDVANSSNGLKGVVERTPAWVAASSSCKAKVPAPELATETRKITCS